MSPDITCGCDIEEDGVKTKSDDIHDMSFSEGESSIKNENQETSIKQEISLLGYLSSDNSTELPDLTTTISYHTGKSRLNILYFCKFCIFVKHQRILQNAL